MHDVNIFSSWTYKKCCFHLLNLRIILIRVNIRMALNKTLL